jgi:RNA recognition motif-containing protein
MSNSKLYVGNLSFDSSESDIRGAFEQCGQINDVYVAMDRMTGRPRGFAFVTMDSPESAQAAITKLHGSDLGGRALTVNEARPKEAGAGGGGRAGGFGGSRGRY